MASCSRDSLHLTLASCCHNSKGRFLVATLVVVTPRTTTTTISTASATVAVVVVVAQPLHGTSIWAVLLEVVTSAGVADVKGAAASVQATTASMVATATLHKFATTSTVKVCLSGQPFSVTLTKVLGVPSVDFFLWLVTQRPGFEPQQARFFALLLSPLYKTLQNLQFGCKNPKFPYAKPFSICMITTLYNNSRFFGERLALHTFLARAPCVARPKMLHTPKPYKKIDTP